MILRPLLAQLCSRSGGSLDDLAMKTLWSPSTVFYVAVGQRYNFGYETGMKILSDKVLH